MATDTFWADRITAVKEQIDAVEAVLLLLATAGNESYKLDTGQTVQWVTKTNIPQLNTMLASLMNRYATLTARTTGCGVVHARPGF